MLVLAAALHATEFHVASNGEDSNPGTRSAPLRTVQRGADLAQPGDTVTVHEGVYRERVNPPRGGESRPENPAPGPFEKPGNGQQEFKVWPTSGVK
jgi:hypothetical protein